MQGADETDEELPELVLDDSEVETTLDMTFRAAGLCASVTEESRSGGEGSS